MGMKEFHGSINVPQTSHWLPWNIGSSASLHLLQHHNLNQGSLYTLCSLGLLCYIFLDDYLGAGGRV